MSLFGLGLLLAVVFLAVSRPLLAAAPRESGPLPGPVWREGRRLVFGSAAQPSVAPDALADLGGWFSVRTELERLLGRGVDLVESPAVRNPYVRADIERTRELVYAA